MLEKEKRKLWETAATILKEGDFRGPHILYMMVATRTIFL